MRLFSRRSDVPTDGAVVLRERMATETAPAQKMLISNPVECLKTGGTYKPKRLILAILRCRLAFAGIGGHRGGSHCSQLS